MSIPSLKNRMRQAEMMDDPNVDPVDLDHAMRHLEIINRLLNGYGPSIAGIRQLIEPHDNSFSLLDVGCGSGDTLREIARWCRKKGITAKLTGIELSSQSAQRAADACSQYPEIEIRQQDVFEMAPDDRYDIVHSALVMHHFSDDDNLAQALACMGRAANRGVIINDLHRHWLAWWSIWGLTRVCSRSIILQNDAPLSVGRSFTRQELKDFTSRAGFSRVQIKWHWAFRWLAIATNFDGNPSLQKPL